MIGASGGDRTTHHKKRDTRRQPRVTPAPPSTSRTAPGQGSATRGSSTRHMPISDPDRSTQTYIHPKHLRNPPTPQRPCNGRHVPKPGRPYQTPDLPEMQHLRRTVERCAAEDRDQLPTSDDFATSPPNELFRRKGCRATQCSGPHLLSFIVRGVEIQAFRPNMRRRRRRCAVAKGGTTGTIWTP
jgi:hypothetical protein